jgi:trehalose synthase
MSMLDDYAEVAGSDVIAQLRQLARPLADARVVHVNSTRVGGGVAEILTKLVPLMQELGIDTRWEVITGESEFFECTKGMHNTLQGNRIPVRSKYSCGFPMVIFQQPTQAFFTAD